MKSIVHLLDGRSQHKDCFERDAAAIEVSLATCRDEVALFELAGHYPRLSFSAPTDHYYLLRGLAW